MPGRPQPYDYITIIFNPSSTGSSKQLATRLSRLLIKKYPDRIALLPTRHAGHAKKIAYKAALAHSRPLIISVSGDGGYHEVINGVVSAVKDDPTISPIVAVEAAGNANDHYRHIRNGDSLYAAIMRHTIKKLELIKVEIHGIVGKDIIYAHSYWGIGLTPIAGDRLNKEELNPVKEKVIVAQELIAYKPIEVTMGDTTTCVNNIIAAKVGRMSKVFKLDSTETAPPQGKLRLLIDAEPTKASLLKKIIKGMTTGLADESKFVAAFTCKIHDDTKMQLDGEIYPLSRGDSINVSVSSTKLLTL